MADENPLPPSSWLGSRLRRLFKTFGVADTDGDLSFNKSMTLAAMGSFVYMVIRAKNPPTDVLFFGMVALGAGFGLKGYLGGMARGTYGGQTNTSIDIKGQDLVNLLRAAREKRNAANNDHEESGQVPQVHGDE